MSLGSHRGVGLNDISGGCRVRLWAEGCRPHCIEPTTILLPIESMYEHDDPVYNMFQKGSQDIIGERDFVPSPARCDVVHSLNKEWDFVSQRFA